MTKAPSPSPSLKSKVSGMGFCCSSYKNKTTRTFEHRGEAWRVLVGAKVVLFIESTKLFDGNRCLSVDFVSFLKFRHKVNGSRMLFEFLNVIIL